MSFYVGQKVRVLWAATSFGTPHVGKEAVIVETMELHSRIGYGLDICPIIPDAYGFLAWGAHQLAPIIPDGLESLDRINELYEPEPEVIRV